MTMRLMHKILLSGTAGLAVALAAASGPACAQAPLSGDAPALAGNIVGGGSATISGGGDEMVITYSEGGAGGGSIWTQVPRLAQGRNTDSGGLSIQYLEPERAPAGREAWLVGGGDGIEVVYADPMPGRRR